MLRGDSGEMFDLVRVLAEYRSIRELASIYECTGECTVGDAKGDNQRITTTTTTVLLGAMMRSLKRVPIGTFLKSCEAQASQSSLIQHQRPPRQIRDGYGLVFNAFCPLGTMVISL